MGASWPQPLPVPPSHASPPFLPHPPPMYPLRTLSSVCCSYKAYFRWEHYAHPVIEGTTLPDETEPCASVTSAFLRVLHALFEAEQARKVTTGVRNSMPRNILRMLSAHTRRTKVVELSSGTHRVPDELRRHTLQDQAGNQYSTNLDRNRYGSDDNYLFTVIKFDLEYLGLCPALVDVEIIDSKNKGRAQVRRSSPNHPSYIRLRLSRLSIPSIFILSPIPYRYTISSSPSPSPSPSPRSLPWAAPAARATPAGPAPGPQRAVP